MDKMYTIMYQRESRAPELHTEWVGFDVVGTIYFSKHTAEIHLKRAVAEIAHEVSHLYTTYIQEIEIVNIKNP